ncbi:MAG TPA: FAD-binding protein, partial [Aquirhabdus sp.]
MTSPSASNNTDFIDSKNDSNNNPLNQSDSDNNFDVIIVGSGAAGLTLALSLPSHLQVAVMAKADLTEASTYYAQGGLAAVLDETDSTDNHIEDTLIAGAGLCHRDAVAFTVEGGRAAVDFLLKQGVRFT